ncbi:MAG TPA: serine/threonine-protein kinase, partial [Gaiellaceae bacterium]|nr:serine/threonine-protein kinase [Gaiellaceae bacterium]
MADEVIAGRYRLLEPLGRGAMSAVWLAHDEELQRRVAVKTLAPSADRQRFAREARAVAALSHPNICGLYDYGEADGRPYMVLEYLPNGSLEDRLKRGALSDAETTRVASEVAAGLAHAHDRGLVHRDLKPANILFDPEGRAKIADFGIARMGGSGTLTEAGTVLGTASYISPEQAAGEPAGPASDVYSFGVILFRMLTGSLPFVSANAMELVRMHRDVPPPAVADVRPDAPPRLAAIATAALAKDPAARPADGAALVAALQETDTTAATMIVPPAPSRSRGRRLPLLAALVAVLVLAGVAVAVALTHGGGGGVQDTQSLPGLSLPAVAAESSASSAVSTTAPLTTTAQATSTAATTTAPSTPSTTVAPPATTAPAIPTTTETVPTTTFTPPTTTVA